MTYIESPKNKISEKVRTSHDQFLRKDRSTLASSIYKNIHSAHRGHAQNERYKAFPTK